MTIAVATELAPTCQTGALPVAALEVFESPDSVRISRALQLEVETTVQVVEGIVCVSTDEDEWVLTPGDSATVAAGVPYRRWNAGDDHARYVEFYCAA
jgi:mannose-6-phosphate isomerase-like protein (cupin superfamily)